MSVVRIAERAGVSIATVSRVLNNSRRVQPEMAEQVRRAAAELGVGPARAKRGSGRSSSAGRQGRTRSIGLIALGHGYQTWLGLPVMASVVAEVMRVAEEHELAVHVAEMADPQQLCSVVQRRAVDGVLVFIASHLDAAAAEPLRRQLPIVRVMGAQFAASDIDHVAPDNLAVGHLAGEHLLARGCRRPAFLSLAPDWALSQLRAGGFGAATARAGVPASAFLLDAAPAVQATYGASSHARATLPELVNALLAYRPDGLFVARDDWLFDVYRALADRGVRPDEDVQVISCDNEDVRLSMLRPRPASIDLNAPEIARRAVRRLVARIKHPQEPPFRILVNPQLAAPPARIGGAVEAGAGLRSMVGA